jgi:glycosyltransferase involved in cell wall biosynthesis
MRLAMTLLVRDEADIVDANIRFHLAHGADHVIVTDNGSTDGTVEIMEAYVRAGVLTLLHDADETYRQGEIVTRMAVLAREKFAADWVLNNDADEFWLPTAADLKQEIGSTTATQILCRRTNMVGPREDERPWAFDRQVHRVANPLPLPEGFAPTGPGSPIASLPRPFAFYAIAPKALLRASAIRRVHQGSHAADLAEDRPVLSRGISILHFPYRGWQRFRRRVLAGGTAYARNKELPWRIGWHWRRWYALAEAGELEREYERVHPRRADIQAALAEGLLVVDRRLAEA